MNPRESHKSAATEYGQQGAEAYATHRHGPDGDKFLDVGFVPYITEGVESKTVADIGTGAAPWAKMAAENGAIVFASDIQSEMLAKAKENISQVEGVSLVQADGASLPFPDRSVDLALSINVACNLPETHQVGQKDTKRSVGFAPHFNEMARILKSGGKGVITAPANFGEVFTDNLGANESVPDDVDEIVNQLIETTEPGQKQTLLLKIGHINRATFAKRDGKWKLIKDENQLVSGEPIFRKLPGLLVPNYYHSHQEYLSAIEAAGLHVVETKQLKFSSEQERLEYNNTVAPNRQLGPEYVNSNPFDIFIVEK